MGRGVEAGWGASLNQIGSVDIVTTEPAIRSAVESDLAQLCATFARSFWDDPVMRWLFPADEMFQGGAVMRDFFRRLIANGNGLVTPDVAGFAMWIAPGRPEVELDEGDEPGDMPPPEMIEKLVALREAIATNTPVEDHWYLQMVGTHPDWQRRGIARALIERGKQWASRDGLGMYLETETVANVAYYRQLGFEVRSEWDVAAGGPHMWGMWHPA